MAKAPRLKTYEAEIDGLHQWIVAAPNQRAALDAFGVRQDLFAQGLAKVSDDEAAQAAAVDHPGQPLRRLKGSDGPFKAVTGGGLDAWAAAAAALPPKPQAALPPKPPATKAPKPAPSSPRPKPKLTLVLPPPSPPPNRKALDQAEAALRRFEAKAARDLERLAQAQADLDERRSRIKADQKTERAALAKALEEARSDFRRAGGQP